MPAAATMDRPVDETFEIPEDVRCCDSQVIDSTVEPPKIISRCPHPAEWCYVMRCCGGRALACNPCHDSHVNPAPSTKQRHCICCQVIFTTLGESTISVYRV